MTLTSSEWSDTSARW